MAPERRLKEFSLKFTAVNLQKLYNCLYLSKSGSYLNALMAKYQALVSTH